MSRTAKILAALLHLLLALGLPRSAGAQAFGIQDRANAAAELVVLGVSQAIAALPPAAAQSFSYDFDPQLQTFTRSEQLGPTVLRSTETLPRGALTARIATTYFALSNRQPPIDYEITGLPMPLYTKFGAGVDAKVGIINLSSSYGLLDRVELYVNVPLTVVSATARSSFVSYASEADLPIEEATIVAAPSIRSLDTNLADGTLIIREGSVDKLNASFNDGTSVGLGRVSLGTKALVVRGSLVSAAVSLDVFLPSPSSAEFAGPDSFAIVPRAISSLRLTKAARLHADAGYDYDTEYAELRSFTWSFGGSYAFSGATLDGGVAGNVFAEGIEWTPSRFVQPPGSLVDVPLEFQALGDNQLGTNYVNFLLGAKIAIASNTVLSGSVYVPLNDVGIRPAAAGTLALELTF